MPMMIAIFILLMGDEKMEKRVYSLSRSFFNPYLILSLYYLQPYPSMTPDS